MSSVNLSHHAETRMRQRGLRNSDIDLILQCASEIGDDLYFLSRKDVDREISRRKDEIQALERLRGQKVVVAEETVVTCYKSRRSDQRRFLRKGREIA
jgi:hypothetical protein